jgi:hypothetical protein
MDNNIPTSIVNLRHRNADVNCGRGFSIFGNPFEIGKDGTREEVCNKYKEYFQKRILTDSSFRDRVVALKGKKLGCWCRCIPECNHPKCKNQRCHVETILSYLNQL